MGIFDVLQSFGQKALFYVSASNLTRKWKRFKTHRREQDPTKTIRLAVVGARSSGKTFFLRDIIDALNSTGAAYFPLDRDGFRYIGFSSFLRSQSKTDLYACRRSNHFGQTVQQERKEYDFDFLNIPGEIFGSQENIDTYLELRDALNINRKLFTVTTYTTEASDEEWLIVEPRKNATITDSNRFEKKSNPLNDKGFRGWNDIFGSLNEQGFKLREGSKRAISGKELLKNFFEYDTDSVISSISDIVKTKQINVSFDEAAFNDNKISLNFVFFQYCALATDVVVCDRIFVKIDAGDEEIEFGTLTENLSRFFNDKAMRKPHVYLAFRNVDFLLKEKELEYQRLCNDVLKSLSPERKRNIIYSIFNYAILHYVFGYDIPNNEFNSKIGIPDENIRILSNGSVSGDDIAKAFVDFSHKGGIVHRALNFKNHITTRIGGRGIAFQRLLAQTGWVQRKGQTIIPHVYFTCTPITEGFEIYENRIIKEERDSPDKVVKIIDVTGTTDEKDGSTSFDFYREKGLDNKFSAQCSCECFGSYQLLMDILIQHGIYNKFEDGQLLRMLRDVRKS